MEEKVLIKSEKYDVKKVIKVMVIIGVVIAAIIFFIAIGDHMDYYDYSYEEAYEKYLDHQEYGRCGYYYEDWEKCYDCELVEEYSSSFGYALERVFVEGEIFVCLLPVAGLALIGGLIYLWLHSYELTVTDKRIYGKVAWGKRVDLPVDSISATATIRLLKGVSVSTSSGRISFRVIKNADEIYKVMNNLIIERQQEKVNATVAASKSDEADQLKKFKDLLDSGVITQEEFDAKKKQLLDL